MRIAGKCPPEPDELESAHDRGFRYVELYLEKNHLQDIDRTAEIVDNSPVEVVSIHTPHVTLQESDYFLKADRLAQRLDAFLVFHSQYMHHVHIPQIEKLDLESDYGYENQPGASQRIIESTVIGEGHDLVLDTAHFYMGEKDYPKRIKQLLEDPETSIPLMHLCDSTRTEDGLAFGDGEMEMERLCQIIDEEFDGILVLEVMPDYQEDALEKWRRYTS